MRQVLTNVVVTVGGSALAAGAYWGLLNVPESNVLALGLSALLVILAVVLVGLTLAAVLAHAGGRSLGQALRQAPRRLPFFLLGVVAFAALWALTAFIEAQWVLHQGEIDAMLLRYGGTANTGWLFTSVSWVLWLVRWGLGLAIVAGLTAGRPALAVSGLPLGATVAALLTWWAMSGLAYWRPRAIPADSAEVIFVAAKLGVLALVSALLVVAVLTVFARRTATSA